MNVALIQPRNGYTNIILHWIAHFRDQVNKTEARARPKCSRPRPTCRGRGQGQNFGLKASLASMP